MTDDCCGRAQPAVGSATSEQVVLGYIRKQVELGGGGCTPLIPAPRRQRQVDLCEFKASLVYKSLFQNRLQSYRETLSCPPQHTHTQNKQTSRLNKSRVTIQ